MIHCSGGNTDYETDLYAPFSFGSCIVGDPHNKRPDGTHF